MLGNRYADWGSKTLTHSSPPPPPPFLEFLLHLSSRRTASRQTPFPRSGLRGFKTSLFSFLGTYLLRAGGRQSSPFNATGCQSPGRSCPGHRPVPSLCHRAKLKVVGSHPRVPAGLPAEPTPAQRHTKGRRGGNVTGPKVRAFRGAFRGCQAAQPLPRPRLGPEAPRRPTSAPHSGKPRREGGRKHGAPGKEGESYSQAG